MPIYNENESVVDQGSLVPSGSFLPPPNGWLTDADVNGDAAIAHTKVVHLHKAGTHFDLAIGGTPAAREEIVYVCNATGGATLQRVSALLNDTGTTSDVDFDLKVNGSSVLSAAVNVTNADSDRAVKDGTISTASLSEDDVVSISLAVTTSTGAQGPYAYVVISEEDA